MTRFFLLFALVLFAAPALALDGCGGVNLFEQLPASEQNHLAEITAQSPYPTGNIWRASKPGSTVYLIGTMHLSDPRAHSIVETGQKLIEQADRVFFEVLQADQNYMQAQMATNLEIGFIDKGPTLPELLSPAEWEQLQTILRDYKIPAFFAAKMQPWVLGMTLSIPACALPAAARKDGIDNKLMEIANTAGIPAQALDDIDDLLALLGGAPIEEQIEDLKLAMSLNSDPESMFKTTKDLYFSGQHQMIIEFGKYWLLRENPENAQRLEQAYDSMMVDLLETRNAKWIQKLLPSVSEGTSVVAVGAGHLSGTYGILQQLENAGYKITPYDN